MALAPTETLTYPNYPVALAGVGTPEIVRVYLPSSVNKTAVSFFSASTFGLSVKVIVLPPTALSNSTPWRVRAFPSLSAPERVVEPIEPAPFRTLP